MTRPFVGLRSNPLTIRTLTELLLTVGRFDGDLAYVSGLVSPLDGTGGWMEWDSDSTATHDGDDVVKPTAIDASAPGRWLRAAVQPQAGSVDYNELAPPLQPYDNVAALRAATGMTDGQPAKVLGYYAPGDGGGGSLYWSAASTATHDGVLVFKPTAISPANPGRWLRFDYTAITAKMAGAKTDGTDTTAAILLAITTAQVNGLKFKPEPGTYRCDSAISYLVTGGFFDWEAAGDVVFDFSNCVAATALQIGGVLGASAALGADCARYAKAITCGLSVASGDLLLIKSTDSWSPLSASYVKGEFVEVESAAAGTITLKQPLYDNYTAATTTVQIVGAAVVRIKGIEFVRNSNDTLVDIRYANHTRLDYVSAHGGRNRCIQLWYCHDSDVYSCYTTDSHGAVGLSYGLAISSCQKITVRSGIYLGGRHGVVTGGEIPCRDMVLEDGTSGRFSTATTGSLGTHENTEFVTIKNWHSSDGADIAGRNITIDGLTCNMVASTDGLTVSVTKSGGYVDIKGVNIGSPGTAGFNGLDVLFGDNNIVIDRLSIDDVTINATTPGIQILLNSKTGCSVKQIHVGDKCSVTTAGNGVLIGTSGERMPVTDCYVGGHYESSTDVAVNVLGVESVGVLEISADVTMTGNFIPIDVRGFHLARVTRGRIKGNSNGVVGIRAIDVEEFHVYNNDIDTASNGVQSTVSSLASALMFVHDNRYTGVTTPAAVGAGVLELAYQGPRGERIAWGTAAPAAGTWVQGDHVYNRASAVGQPKGWYCTVSGTPGTWVSEGNL